MGISSLPYTYWLYCVSFGVLQGGIILFHAYFSVGGFMIIVGGLMIYKSFTLLFATSVANVFPGLLWGGGCVSTCKTISTSLHLHLGDGRAAPPQPPRQVRGSSSFIPYSGPGSKATQDGGPFLQHLEGPRSPFMSPPSPILHPPLLHPCFSSLRK